MYDGESITYDAEGNPTSYRGHTMTWSRNRLTSAYYNNQTISYTYDANGLRTGKNTGYDEYTYYYSGTKLIKINYGYNNDAYFYYGADGRPYAINYSGILYYYILNLQGDVVGLCDENGNVVVYYAYDAWGKVTIRSASNTYLANFNPLRYRGYFYDQETGLYYLHNRYYDPETGRFISADAYLVAGNHINSTNMFAYCLNNPVMYVDPSGRDAEVIDPSTQIAIATALEAFVAAFGTALPVVGILIGLAIVVDATYRIINSVPSDKVTTKTRPDTVARIPDKHKDVYRLAYMDSEGNLVKVGPSMSFTAALTALGVSGAKNSLEYTYKFKKRKASDEVKKIAKEHKGQWGIYTRYQTNAKALAVVFGCNNPPEYHGYGYYGHYHDSTHSFHIWYGEPINEW